MRVCTSRSLFTLLLVFACLKRSAELSALVLCTGTYLQLSFPRNCLLQFPLALRLPNYTFTVRLGSGAGKPLPAPGYFMLFLVLVLLNPQPVSCHFGTQPSLGSTGGDPDVTTSAKPLLQPNGTLSFQFPSASSPNFAVSTKRFPNTTTANLFLSPDFPPTNKLSPTLLLGYVNQKIR